jgi:hypothetical protein
LRLQGIPDSGIFDGINIPVLKSGITGIYFPGSGIPYQACGVPKVLSD